MSLDRPVARPEGAVALRDAGAGRVVPAGQRLAAARRDRRLHRAVSDTLVTIARGAVPELDPAVRAAPDALVAALRHHRLAPLAHVLLRDSEPGLAALLAEDRDRAMAMHLHVTTLLGHLGALFDPVPWVVLKGPVLSETAHPVRGLRSYRDIDVLVAPGDLRRVSVQLRAAGWRVVDHADTLRHPDLPGEMHWRSPSGIQLDLHWNVVNEAERRRRLRVPTADLLARRVPTTLGFGPAWTLDPVDRLLHVCIHAVLSGVNRLVYLLDAQGTAAHVTDWEEVRLRAAAWDATSHVAFVLRRARSALGGPIPADVERVLGASPAFRGLTAVVDRLAPVARTRTEHGAARLFARAVRPGAVRTTLATSRSVSRYLLGMRPPPEPGHRPFADSRTLEAYLDRVDAVVAAGRG
ncbi:MAG TPA: nucleotidyltransferase family protein [Actinomycetaceae bacterium]|nr:nucleotidyltransferase family protein [Actinomycetaceae bacterium]